MLKNIGIITGFVLIQSSVTAQSIKPSVVSTGGGYFKNTDYSISYTIGELVAPTLVSGNSIITQGFQQPTEMFVSVSEKMMDADVYSIYPNPFSHELRIDAKNGGYAIEIALYDLLGRQIGATRNVRTIPGETNVLDTEHLSSGVYIIRIVNTERFTSSEFKLTKL